MEGYISPSLPFLLKNEDPKLQVVLDKPIPLMALAALLNYHSSSKVVLLNVDI